MNNTRFSTAIHIMTLLTHFPNTWTNSDFIAGSININPVIVRKELIILQNAGLVLSKKGKEGGSKLAKNSQEITLDAIYLAIKSTEVLGKKNHNPNPLCPVGNKINNALDILFSQTENLLIEHLRTQTLGNFANLFH